MELDEYLRKKQEVADYVAEREARKVTRWFAVALLVAAAVGVLFKALTS